MSVKNSKMSFMIKWVNGIHEILTKLTIIEKWNDEYLEIIKWVLSFRPTEICSGSYIQNGRSLPNIGIQMEYRHREYIGSIYYKKKRLNRVEVYYWTNV